MSTRCQIEFFDGDVEHLADGAEPVARVYKHSDGYVSNMLPLLKELEKALAKPDPSYGTRTDDPEYAAADFVCRYRLPHGTPEVKGDKYRRVGQDGNRTPGNIYVSQSIHHDIAFLYRVICKSSGWIVKVFSPKYDEKYDITGFEPYEQTIEEQREVLAAMRPKRKAKVTV